MAATTPEFDVQAPLNSRVGLGPLLSQQALNSPNASAIIDGETIVTYAQLHSSALKYASILLEQGIQVEEPVGILFGQGVNYVIAQAAVLYAGGTCLLLDAGQSDQQIEEKLKQLGNVRVVTDVRNQCREPLVNYPILLIRFEDSREMDKGVETLSKVPVWTSAEHRSHLIYTSGTTGQPKAVQLAAGCIIRLVNDPKIPICAAHDRVGQISHTGFDGAIFDVWIPLLNGATIVIIHQEIFLDPFAFEKYICQYRVTVFLITTSLFNILAFASPGIFSKMNVVICGGEAANPRAMELVLKHGPPKYLYNGYGPSECSVLTTLHAVTIEDTKGETISIGTPFAGSEVYLLDDSMREVAPGEIGEMFIGGSGLSKGYYNQPELNASRYIQLDGLGHRPMTLYRTGDICSKNEAGNFYFVRRRDHQVKFNGFQVDLQSIDSAVLATGFAQAAVTLKIEQSQDVGPLLVTWITPRSNLTNTECLRHLQTLIQKLLPRGVPPRIELVQEFPLHLSLKIDRNRLKEAYLKKLRLLQANFDSLSSQKKVAMETRLEKIWRDIFLPEKPLDTEESLFTVGGTSLHVPLLIPKIFSEFGTKLSAKVVYENPTLRGLAQSIRAIEQGQLPKSDVTDLLLADASLSSGLEFYDISLSVPNWRSANEGRIFLTGSTGFVGAFLLNDLLQLPEVQSVVCLVRAIDIASGLSRVRQTMQEYKIWQAEFEHKLIIIVGDLGKSQLGMSEESFERLAIQSSVVFRLGAHVSFTQPYSFHRPANVLGMLEMLRFSRTGRVKALHYVSTLSAYGPTRAITRTTFLREDEPPLRHLNAVAYDIGYSQSKWVAEQLVWSEISRGFPICLYRPGFVLGHSITGTLNKNDFISRLITSSIDSGFFPLLPDEYKEFIPVDFVTNSILYISSFAGNIGHAYNLVPERKESLDLISNLRLLGQCGGYHLQGISYKEWVDKVRQNQADSMHPFLPLLEENVYQNLTLWELYRDLVVYDTANTQGSLQALSQPTKPPPLDGNLIMLYLKMWMKR